MPPFSVVIPALNAEATLRACLESVLAQAIPSGFDALEVVVADNGSTDGTIALAESFEGVRVVACATRGPGAARNAGIAATTGEIVACLDSDCVAEPGWASALAQAFATDESIGAVGGQIIAARQETFAERHAAERRVLCQEDAIRGLPGFLPFAITACAAFRRSALDRVGVFDETMLVGEDADLSWRLQWSGWRLAYASAAKVQHHHRASFASYWRQMRSYGRGTALLFAKHRVRLKRRAWFGVDHSGDIRRSLGRGVVALVRSRTPWERAAPWLDLAAQTASLLGKLEGSIRGGVLLL